MKRIGSVCCFFLVLFSAAGQTQSLLPFEEETLRYTVNWPSGLSLGEVEMHARRTKAAGGSAERWEFTMKLDAAVPGFSVVDRYHSTASAQLCSLELEKDFTHGKRKAHEKTIFNPEARTATRQTLGGGGKAEFEIPACARDALTFLYFVRSELARGRVPPAQKIYFGAAYDIRLTYSGRQTLRLPEAVLETDRMAVSVKGPASDVSFEVFFGVDAARRLVLVRLPLQMGLFTMQLAE